MPAQLDLQLDGNLMHTGHWDGQDSADGSERLQGRPPRGSRAGVAAAVLMKAMARRERSWESCILIVGVFEGMKM